MSYLEHFNLNEQPFGLTPDPEFVYWSKQHARAKAYMESTIWLADAAREISGHVITLERSPDKVTHARANLSEAGLAEYVDLKEGDAAEALKQLSGPFDLVFLDANRPQYLTYFELVFPKLVSGGLLVADNVISHAHELTAYLSRVKADSRLFSVTLPVGKGEELSFKL